MKIETLQAQKILPQVEAKHLWMREWCRFKTKKERVTPRLPFPGTIQIFRFVGYPSLSYPRKQEGSFAYTNVYTCIRESSVGWHHITCANEVNNCTRQVGHDNYNE